MLPVWELKEKQEKCMAGEELREKSRKVIAYNYAMKYTALYIYVSGVYAYAIY